MQSVKKAAKEEKKASVAKQEAPAEPKYSIEKLRAHCMKIFGITSSTFDGAFYGRTEDMTIKEARRVVTEWLGKEAK